MDREQLARRLESLHQAALGGDWGEVEHGLQELDAAKTAAFAQGIRKMASDLYAEMRALQLDSRLARAAAEIPDACSRLDAVIELTEQAATRTLDLVEDSREHIVALQDMADEMAPGAAAEQLVERTPQHEAEAGVLRCAVRPDRSMRRDVAAVDVHHIGDGVTNEQRQAKGNQQLRHGQRLTGDHDRWDVGRVGPLVGAEQHQVAAQQVSHYLWQYFVIFLPLHLYQQQLILDLIY